MTNQPTNAKPGVTAAAASTTPVGPKMQEQTQGASTKQMLLEDIRVKWSKFTEQELSGLKNNDDLVSQIVAKYGLDKAQAQRDADVLRAGRNI